MRIGPPYTLRRTALLAAFLAGTLLNCAPPAGAQIVSFTQDELRRIRRHSPLEPAPRDTTNRAANHPVAAHLGRFLFYDTGLSSNGSVSCATCHNPKRGFADGKPLAEALGRVNRHSPSLWNVVYNRWYYWDGRADSLWAQAMGPIENPAEMGFSRVEVAHYLNQDARLRNTYVAVFGPLPDLSDEKRFPETGRPIPDHPQHPHHVAWSSMKSEDQATINRVFTNVCKAIAAYESLLISRHSAFDVFVEGLEDGDAEKLRALSTSAQRGLKLFVGKANCRLCHGGPNFTDGEFHDTRVSPLNGGRPRDAGRLKGARKVLMNPFNAAGEYSDDRSSRTRSKLEFLANPPENWGRFKTPSLRNVALSPPYMHQGQFATLGRVLLHYSTMEGALPPGHHREVILKPLNLAPGEIDDLLAFLQSLTDIDIDPELMRQPKSPVGETLKSQKVKKSK